MFESVDRLDARMDDLVCRSTARGVAAQLGV